MKSPEALRPPVAAFSRTIRLTTAPMHDSTFLFITIIPLPENALPELEELKREIEELRREVYLLRRAILPKVELSEEELEDFRRAVREALEGESVSWEELKRELQEE